MKTLISLFITFFTIAANAETTEFNLTEFAQNYYQKMVATQAPDATENQIDEYLALLADDVGHTHLPWVVDDTRYPDGKEKMKEGMLFYLGAHTEFSSELLDVNTFNTSAIAIRYHKHAKGIHPQSKQPIEYTQTIMEVLEMDGERVGVIRKYHQ